MLQKVDEPKAKAEEKPKTESASKSIDKENKKEESQGDDVELLKKLVALRKVTKKKKEANKMTLKNFYHESFFFRMLGMLDFYTSLS